MKSIYRRYKVNTTNINNQLNTYGRKKLLLIDCSNLIIAGLHSNVMKKFSISRNTLSGETLEYRTGGIYNLLNILRRRGYNLNDTIYAFVFDRPSQKKKKYRERFGINTQPLTDKDKRNRTEFLISSQILEQYLEKAGFNTIYSDEDGGYEADDLIFSLVNKYYGAFEEIHIASSDRDLSVCLDPYNKVKLLGINGMLELMCENFYSAYGKTIHIPYGTTYLYQTLVGKSNEGRTNQYNQALFDRFIQTLRDNQVPLSALQDPKYTEMAIREFFKDDKDELQKYLEIFELIKVRNKEDVHLHNQDINMEVFKELCSLFRLKTIASKFGIILDNQPNKQEYKYVMKLIEKVNNHDVNININELYGDNEERNKTTNLKPSSLPGTDIKTPNHGKINSHGSVI